MRCLVGLGRIINGILIYSNRSIIWYVVSSDLFNPT